MPTADDQAVEALLARPDLRPAGGWSAVAEEWTDLRMTASFRTAAAEVRASVRVRLAEQDADMLAALLEAERAQRRHDARRPR